MFEGVTGRVATGIIYIENLASYGTFVTRKYLMHDNFNTNLVKFYYNIRSGNVFMKGPFCKALVRMSAMFSPVRTCIGLNLSFSITITFVCVNYLRIRGANDNIRTCVKKFFPGGGNGHP